MGEGAVNALGTSFLVAKNVKSGILMLEGGEFNEKRTI
jgi:hypothetical protein